MKRFQISLNVSDVDEAVAFYRHLLNAEPAKLEAGYANFAVADPPLKLVLIEGEGTPGAINHLGVEVENPDDVSAEAERLAAAGLATRIDPTHTCCHATQDKVWVADPDAIPWEIYAVLAHTAEFGARAR